MVLEICEHVEFDEEADERHDEIRDKRQPQRLAEIVKDQFQRVDEDAHGESGLLTLDLVAGIRSAFGQTPLRRIRETYKGPMRMVQGLPPSSTLPHQKPASPACLRSAANF